MKTPRYTDLHRYPRPYRRAVDTDVSTTFAAEYRRLAEAAKLPVVRIAKIRMAA